MDLKTGKVLWSEEQFRAGTVTLAGDRLLIMRESGELVMAEASPAGFKPVARARILPAVVRAYPALSDGLFYVRNGDTRAMELVFAPATPEAFRPAARARVLKSECRAHAALADGRFYARDQDALVCVDLRGQ